MSSTDIDVTTTENSKINQALDFMLKSLHTTVQTARMTLTVFATGIYYYAEVIMFYLDDFQQNFASARQHWADGNYLAAAATGLSAIISMAIAHDFIHSLFRATKNVGLTVAKKHATRRAAAMALTRAMLPFVVFIACGYVMYFILVKRSFEDTLDLIEEATDDE